MEAEVRRQSPGVIAKLMGLEGIPSHSQQISVKLQDSKEFDDTVKVLLSNKDLLPKVLQHPDPLFSNHVNDVWETTFVSHWSKNASVRNPVVARCCETSNPCSKSSSETIPPKRGRSLENFQNCVPSQTPIALDDSSYISTKGGSRYSFPTRIVVLKPHLGNGDYTPETNLSPSG
ncbi:hypothetical protein MLD38_020265 [Melastoma candidum]|uniref:Uncharacterized protein n=1 Tax=Melastoma candidum TaxID=119954 RepID=A0ACB9QDL5_9MYRT|nr:hypothetical protein MLD38_020265 [Melastoma candidum]